MMLCPYRLWRPVAEKFVLPSVFTWYKNPGTTTRANTTQKPVFGDQWLIRHFARADSYVYVPFAGTGSAVIASFLEGRNVLAVDQDIDPLYGRFMLFQRDMQRLTTQAGLTFIEPTSGKLTSPLQAYHAIMRAVDPAVWGTLNKRSNPFNKEAVDLRHFENGAAAVQFYLRGADASDLSSFTAYLPDKVAELEAVFERLKPEKFNWEVAEAQRDREKARDIIPFPLEDDGTARGSEAGGGGDPENRAAAAEAENRQALEIAASLPLPPDAAAGASRGSEGGGSATADGGAE
jgi:hypothetical protein